MVDESLHMLAYQGMINIADTAGSLETGGQEGEFYRPLTQADLKNWQRLIGSEQHKWGDYAMSDRSLGIYREHGIAISGVGAIGSGRYEIQRDMDELWETVNGVLPMDAVVRGTGLGNDVALMRAAVVHHRFERCHPFSDGNGRTGRLLSLYVLRRHGAKPVLFTSKDRTVTYYPSFRTSDPALMIGYFRTHQVDDW